MAEVTSVYWLVALSLASHEGSIDSNCDDLKARNSWIRNLAWTIGLWIWILIQMS